MCGIAGVILESPGPVGRYLVDMITSIQHRGPDSTGFVLYGEPGEGLRVCIRLLDGAGAEDAFRGVVQAVTDIGGHVLGAEGEPKWDSGASRAPTDRFVELQVRGVDDVRELLAALEGEQGVEVHSIGTTLRLVKDVGTAHDVSARHGIDAFVGTHGLAHCRLATESQVDVAHSHPFWSRTASDLAVVHNGQITNYHKLRRIYEQKGYDFATQNDSELIGVYVAAKMREGASLEEALLASVGDLDGCFTYLISTTEGIGMAKDSLAAKPLVVGEAHGVTVMASEEASLYDVLGEELESFRPVEREVMTWSTSTLTV